VNIYDLSVIESAIEKIASENEGEIPDVLLQQLVEAQTQSLVQIEKLVNYIKHAEMFIGNCKAEESRIAERRQIVENRIASMKNYLVPYVDERGKFDTGTFTLSTRKSASVELDDNFNNPDYCVQVISYKPDKKKIKEVLQAGERIQGAKLIEKKNLQIK